MAGVMYLSDYSFVQIYAWEWDCWIKGATLTLFEELPVLFSTVASSSNHTQLPALSR